MNVLVYAGPGTTTESVKHCLETLRQHLSPYYAVVAVGERALLCDPWQLKTKALVFPGGADLPYCQSFNGAGNRVISDYVRRGGRFMGFCAGGYYASARCEFEAGTAMEVSGPRELAFYPGTCRGCAYKGFVYSSHDGARVCRLATENSFVYTYYNGGGLFVNAARYKNVEVLARFEDRPDVDSEDGTDAAVVLCTVGKGKALLAGSHPEYTPTLMKAEANDTQFQSIIDKLSDKDVDHSRRVFMKACLQRLGLKVNEDVDFSFPRLTPIHLSSYLNPDKLLHLEQKLRENLDFVNNNTYEDKNDTLCFHDASEPDELLSSSEPHDSDDVVNSVKHVKLWKGQGLPDGKQTPYFNMNVYFKHLEHLYASNNVKGVFGQVTGYCEVITSTNTIMDHNPGWLRHLPHGMVITATTQVSGRGRGGNVWVNPKGVMAMSTIIRIPSGTPAAANIVSLQYMLSLAVVEAILSYGSDVAGQGAGYEEMPVKIKWPNDVYALKPEYFNDFGEDQYSATVDGDEEKFAKISGSIVNSQYLDKCLNLVVGIGINVSNQAPTQSLNIILDKLNEIRARRGLPALPYYRHELLFARAMFTLNQFYSVFEKAGMRPFLPLYYKRWLHSGQIVAVQTDSRLRKCRIEGITEDNGLLKVVDTANNERLELQPDGNSFDMFKGLVYRKS